MGDTAMEGLSDRGSIPLRSIRARGSEPLWGIVSFGTSECVRNYCPIEGTMVGAFRQVLEALIFAPKEDEAYIRRLSEEYTERILKLHPAAVLCQGEFNVVYQVVNRLLKQRIPVLVGCSRRMAEESEGKKIVTYQFRRFRKYETPGMA